MQRRAAHQSLSLRVGFPSELHGALFVRDVLRLDPDPAVGAYTPYPGPLRHGHIPDLVSILNEKQRGIASRQWGSWWTALVHGRQAGEGIGIQTESSRPPRRPPALANFDPPEFASLAASPELRIAVRSVWPDMQAWERQRKIHLAAHAREEHAWVPKLADDVRVARGNEPEGSLLVDVLDADGVSHWILSSSHVLVLRGCLDDREAYSDLINALSEHL
jgi:hypothetical protein